MNNSVDRLMSDDSTPAALATELTQVEEAFTLAMISNDVSRIAACIADDWVLVTPEVGVVSRAHILRVIASGELSHDTMTKDVTRVKVYGDTALVTGRGRNTGCFKGQRIAADEWITDVYRRVDGRWLCLLTHLTPVASL
jgi:ketosteroid isomerase-like protein